MLAALCGSASPKVERQRSVGGQPMEKQFLRVGRVEKDKKGIEVGPLPDGPRLPEDPIDVGGPPVPCAAAAAVEGPGAAAREAAEAPARPRARRAAGEPRQLRRLLDMPAPLAPPAVAAALSCEWCGVGMTAQRLGQHLPENNIAERASACRTTCGWGRVARCRSPRSKGWRTPALIAGPAIPQPHVHLSMHILASSVDNKRVCRSTHMNGLCYWMGLC